MDSIVPYKEAFSKYIPEQYKNSEKLLSLVNTCLEQCDSLENAFFEILQSLNLQEAIGPALDWLGAIVGVERIPGESDTSYRSRIVSGMNLKNLPSNEALRLVIKFLTGCDSIGLFPNWPAETYYVLNGSTDADLSVLERENMTSGASLVRGTFLCMESGEGGYIVNDDNGMPFVVDYVNTMDIPDNVLRFTFSNPDYDPTVAGVGPHGTWTKVETSDKNEWDWTTEGITEGDGEFNGAFNDYSSNRVEISCKKFTNNIYGYKLFANNYALVKVELYGFDGLCGTMEQMFYYCQSVEELILKGNYTGLLSATDAFRGCYCAKQIQIDSFGGSTDAYRTFEYCEELKNIAIYNASSVQEFNNTFAYCLELESVFLDCSGATSLDMTFNNCRSLKHITLKDTDNITYMYGVFYNCESLEKAPELETGNITTMQNMFYGCKLLKEVPQYNTYNVQTLDNVFKYCESLEYVPKFDTSNVVDFSGAFYDCQSLKEIPDIDTSKAESVTVMFYGCRNIERGAAEFYNKLSEQITSSTNFNNCFMNCGVATLHGIGDLTKIPTSWGGLGPLSSNTLLFSFSKSDYSPVEAELSGTWVQFDTGYSGNTFNLWTWQDFDTSWSNKFYNTTTELGTFGDNTNAVDIIGAGDTSSVVSVKNMFKQNTALNSICLFDTSSVVDFSSFVSHTGIFELPLFDTSHATTINSIAYDCKNLLKVPLLNTSAITNSSGATTAFKDCLNVESGAYELYKQLQSQFTSYQVPYLPFSNCGKKKLTGVSDLLKIPSGWGGLAYNITSNSVIVSFANSNFDPSDEMPIASGSWSRVSDIANFNAWKFTSSGTDLSEVFKDKFTDSENLIYILGAATSTVVNVDRMFDGCTAVEGGALNLYKQMSTQTTPPENHADTFFDCGTITENGTVELLGVSCHWGGNDLYLMLTDDYVGFMPDAAETEYFIEYIRMYQDLVAMFRNIETKRIYI